MYEEKIFVSIAIILIIGLAGFFVIKHCMLGGSQADTTYSLILDIDHFCVGSDEWAVCSTDGFLFTCDEINLNNILEVNDNLPFKVVVSMYAPEDVTNPLKKYTFEYSNLEYTKINYAIADSDGLQGAEYDVFLCDFTFHDTFKNNQTYFAQISIVLDDREYVSNISEFTFFMDDNYTFNFSFVEEV